MSPFPSSLPKAEAAAWLARLRADDRTPEDVQAFQAWLAENPAHEEAFERVTAVWEVSGAAALPMGVPAFEPRQAVTRQPVLARRSLLAGLAVLTIVGGVTGSWVSARAKVYETGIGEQRHIALPDGSQVFLDADTRIQVDYGKDRRLVALDRGRANFSVIPLVGQPFVVEVAGRRIVASHSTLDVGLIGTDVSVVVISGRAAVSASQAGGHAGGKLLKGGDRLVLAPHRPARLDRPNLTPLLAWQTGQAMFEDDRLDAAAAEMNRYSTVKIVIADPAVAAMRVSGVYRVGNSWAFAESVARLLPVVARQTQDGIALLADRARMTSG